MKLRTDLLAKLTPEMLEEEAAATVHRFKPEPHFSKTGTGSLSPASTSERAAEEERSTGRIQKLTTKPDASGSNAT